MMDTTYELWLALTAIALIVLWLVAEVSTYKHREDATAYWKRKIAENGKRQQWGGK